jgi:hypothetical protein
MGFDPTSTDFYREIRIIITSNTSGSIEEVFFTEDLDSDVDDFIASGLDLVSDTIIEDHELPMGFPIETTLRKF